MRTRVEIYSSERANYTRTKGIIQIPVVLIKIIRTKGDILYTNESIFFLDINQLLKYKISAKLACKILEYTRSHIGTYSILETDFPRLIYKGELEYEIRDL